MSKLQLIGGAVLGAALAMACHHAAALPDVSPPHIAAASAGNRNIDALTAEMTRRYGLTSDQAARLRMILEDQARRFEEVTRRGLPPPEELGRLKSLQSEEIARISAVMTSEQRREYEMEARSALAAPPATAP